MPYGKGTYSKPGRPKSLGGMPKMMSKAPKMPGIPKMTAMMPRVHKMRPLGMPKATAMRMQKPASPQMRTRRRMV